jgi:hypothetical protein
LATECIRITWYEIGSESQALIGTTVLYSVLFLMMPILCHLQPVVVEIISNDVWYKGTDSPVIADIGVLKT